MDYFFNTPCTIVNITWSFKWILQLQLSVQSWIRWYWYKKKLLWFHQAISCNLWYKCFFSMRQMLVDTWFQKFKWIIRMKSTTKICILLIITKICICHKTNKVQTNIKMLVILLIIKINFNNLIELLFLIFNLFHIVWKVNHPLVILVKIQLLLETPQRAKFR